MSAALPYLYQAVDDAARKLARARVAEAEAFLLARVRKTTPTDGYAARAIVETQSHLDQAEGDYWIAKCALLAYANGRFPDAD